MLNYIQKRLQEDGTDMGDYSMVRSRINDILGGILRAEPLKMYSVVCDDTNNSQEDIDNNVLNIELKLVKPPERIHINLNGHTNENILQSLGLLPKDPEETS